MKIEVISKPSPFGPETRAERPIDDFPTDIKSAVLALDMGTQREIYEAIEERFGWYRVVTLDAADILTSISAVRSDVTLADCRAACEQVAGSSAFDTGVAATAENWAISIAFERQKADA